MVAAPLIVELDDNDRLIAVSEAEVMRQLAAMAVQDLRKEQDHGE